MTSKQSNAKFDWDADRYHRVSTPHETWGKSVLDRIQLRGDESALDAGCGSGKLTAELLERLPDGHVLAVDISESMLDAARADLAPKFGDRVSFLQADLAEIKVERPVDVIFSTAALHWVPDHDQLWAAFFDALKPGGKLIAQCGGGDNIGNVTRHLEPLMHEPEFSPYFEGWDGPWNFAGDVETAERLERAGFVEIETNLEHSPVTFPDEASYSEYLETVVLTSHFARLPGPETRSTFAGSLVEATSGDDPPYNLDYWRLNIAAQKPVERP